ncbi:MAG TPA: FtsX-like permease family protein [Mucilaginibacter sp.]
MFILVIACINFVNLVTAKSANRAKEVGLRKVVGSQRSGLIKQFLTESMLYSGLSFIIGLALAWLLLPYFNTLAAKSLTMPWGEWWLLPTILLSAFIIGIVAGLYPAFYLSAFRPVQVLKGALSTGSKNSVLRNSPSLMSIKVKGTDMKHTLQSITAVWKQFAPNQPIRYTFMDENYAKMYADVQRMGRIFTTFAILAIIIACLGLFALSAFMAEQRSKEIGIRKVLGASVSSITRLLSLEFVKLVVLAILIASPIAWRGMNKWLQGFVYHEPVQWWIFVAAGLAAISIALITVSFQSIKAALMNPVKSLKTE